MSPHKNKTRYINVSSDLVMAILNNFYFSPLLSRLLIRVARCSGLVSGVTISWNLLQSESWEFDLIEQKTRIELKLT